MNEVEIAERLTKAEQLGKSCQHRIDKLEKDTEALTEIACSVKVLATQQTNMAEKIDRIDGKVSALEAEPGKKWKNLVGYIIAALCSAGVTALVAYLIK